MRRLAEFTSLGEKTNPRLLSQFKDFPVECLVLNEREAKLCSELNIKTLGNLASTSVKEALAIRNLWYKSVESLMEKLSRFVYNWREIEAEFMKTPFSEILQEMARIIPEKERVFFIRRYLYGETLSEIGKGYGLTREAVRQKILKATHTLCTPNWEDLVNRYLEEHIAPLCKDQSGRLLPVGKLERRLHREYKDTLHIAYRTFMLLEQLYYKDKNTECAKIVRIAKKTLEKAIARAFDSKYRRAYRQGDVGKKIRLLRRLKGWTQAELARHMGCARITINLWEKNKSIPKDKNLKKLAQIFGISTEALFYPS